jgi:DNA-directed RNA polymerase specialized sigma24 family protein
VSSASHDQLFPVVELLGEDNPSRRVVVDAELSDDQAILRLTKQDKNAFQLLFNRFSRLVFSIGLRVLHDQGESEELVQDVFLHLYQKANLFDPSKGRGKGWIVQIAYHRALDRRSFLVRRNLELLRCHITLSCDRMVLWSPLSPVLRETQMNS